MEDRKEGGMVGGDEKEGGMVGGGWKGWWDGRWRVERKVGR